MGMIMMGIISVYEKGIYLLATYIYFETQSGF